MLRIFEVPSSVTKCEFADKCQNATTRKGRSDCSFIKVVTGSEQHSPAIRLGLKPTWDYAGYYMHPGDTSAKVTVLELCDAAQSVPKIRDGLLTLVSGIEPRLVVGPEDLPTIDEVENIFTGRITDPDMVTTNQGYMALEKLTDGVTVNPDRGLAVRGGQLAVVNVYQLGE